MNSLETRIANLELEMENIKAQLEALRAPSSTIFVREYNLLNSDWTLEFRIVIYTSFQEKISGRKKDAELENTESVKDKERGTVIWFIDIKTRRTIASAVITCILLYNVYCILYSSSTSTRWQWRGLKRIPRSDLE